MKTCLLLLGIVLMSTAALFGADQSSAPIIDPPGQQTVRILIEQASPVKPVETPSIISVTPAPKATDFVKPVGEAIAAGVARLAQEPLEATTAQKVKDVLLALLLSIGTSLGGLLMWAVRRAESRAKLSSDEQKAIEALNVGVTEAGRAFYDDFKERAGDGKIDAADALALRNHAIEVAKEVACKDGLNVLKTMAVPRLHDLVERIVLNRQAKAPIVVNTAEAVVADAPAVQVAPVK